LENQGQKLGCRGRGELKINPQDGQDEQDVGFILKILSILFKCC